MNTQDYVNSIRSVLETRTEKYGTETQEQLRILNELRAICEMLKHEMPATVLEVWGTVTRDWCASDLHDEARFIHTVFSGLVLRAIHAQIMFTGGVTSGNKFSPMSLSPKSFLEDSVLTYYFFFFGVSSSVLSLVVTTDSSEESSR